MEIIKKDNYVFSVDIEKTKIYYQTQKRCDCDSCRNYYAQIEEKFPKLTAFLADFGADVSKPDEIAWLEMDNYINYLDVYYTVCGNIQSMGNKEIDIEDQLTLSLSFTNGYVAPNTQADEYFTISVMNIDLPWVLKTPPPTPLKQGIFQKLIRLLS